MNLPNLFIVGAAKAGTTSVFKYLSQHKDVFVPAVKEPNYFSSDIEYSNLRKEFKNDHPHNKLNSTSNNHGAWIDDKSIYQQLYRCAEGKKISLDASVSYLYSASAAENIYRHNPGAKILIVLRNPIERAFSHYLMNLQIGYAKDKPITEIRKDFNKTIKGWGKSHLYVELGLYYEQVSRYMRVFPRSQIKIILFNDLKCKTDHVMADVYKFLGLDEQVIEYEKHNVSIVPAYPLLFVLLKKIYRNTNILIPSSLKDFVKNLIFMRSNPPKLSVDEKRILQSYFKEDVKRLSNLIEMDLNEWLSI